MVAVIEYFNVSLGGDRADKGLRAEIVGKEFKLWYESCM
jgi:hypothetical protein